MTEPLVPVVLCGGVGTRLWPLSRETHPKQFHALLGENSMLQDTLARFGDVRDAPFLVEKPILVCNVEHRFLVASQLQQMGVHGASIILEPQGRNTAPALTVAALQAMESGTRDPILIAMPADHAIADLQSFQNAVSKAHQSAAKGNMVVFGVKANRPETGYGYIQYDVGQVRETHRVIGFVEKPDAERARYYLEAGSYLWNSGIFVVRASVWLKAIACFCPHIFQTCTEAMDNAVRDMDFIRPEPIAFQDSPGDSIDYAVMERLPQTPELDIGAVVVPLDAGWSDVGAWDALWSIQNNKSAQGNVLTGNAVERDCERSMIFSSSRLVAAVGVKDVAVVETPDAVLVVDMRKTQDIKMLLNSLSKDAMALAHSHRKVHRPWGWYDSIDQGARFKVKRLVVNPGSRLSLQMHRHRAEHWVVVRGVAEVTKGDTVFELHENESVYIPVREVHRLSNRGVEPLEIIEVQSGDYLEEDDIIRIDSDY